MEQLQGWEEFERHLIYERYSSRNPDTGERLENTFEDIIERIAIYFSKIKDIPVGLGVINNALSYASKRYLTVGSPALMNLGNPFGRRLGYYSCFPLGSIPDSTKDIMEYQQTCVSIFQYAGGSGLDFSSLRRRNSPVDGGQGRSSGPVGFIPLFEVTAEVISQGGKRRGAMLGQLDYNHPDIFEFVCLKRERRDLGSINLSVNVFKDFWQQKSLIKEIAKSMWISGDPGLLFVETMGINSPYPAALKPFVKYVNPCGEYSSIPFTACNLLSVNAMKCSSPADFEQLGYAAAHLGNAILWLTISREGEGLPKESIHFEKFFNTLKQIRPVGIGLTGLAEFLMMSGKPYTDVNTIKQVYASLARGSLVASAEWAKATGQSAEWDPVYRERHLQEINYPSTESASFWNTTTLCQAPTGSTSQFMRCISTGIEPVKSFQIERNFRDEHTDQLRSVKLVSELAESHSLDEIVDVNPTEQLNVLEAIQGGYIMHTSASKTINVPEETTIEEIEDIIWQAKERGLKGLTIFREGCALESIVKSISKNEVKELSDYREGGTYKFKGMSNIYITVNRNGEDKMPKEVFIEVGKPGSTLNAEMNGAARLASLALRSGNDPATVIRALQGIETGYFFINESFNLRATSICDAVAKALQHSTLQSETIQTPIVSNGRYDCCPICHRFTFEKQGNCKTCQNCGHSTC